MSQTTGFKTVVIDKALKINGVLITSFVTPAPTMTPDSTWRNFNLEDLIKQKAIFSDIIGVSWQKYRTESQTRNQLETDRL